MCSVALVVSDSLRPMDCNTPISSVIGILQARILERVAIPSFRRSSQDQTHISWIADRFFTAEPPGKPYKHEFV